MAKVIRDFGVDVEDNVSDGVRRDYCKELTLEHGRDAWIDMIGISAAAEDDEIVVKFKVGGRQVAYYSESSIDDRTTHNRDFLVLSVNHPEMTVSYADIRDILDDIDADMQGKE